MKAHTDMFNLILVMVFIVAAVPLMISLVYTCNKSKFRYLDDKTVYSMRDIVEYVEQPSTGQMVPVNLSPLRLDKGGTQLIALIQDDYCPEQGMKVNWKLTANKPDGTNNGTAITPLVSVGQPSGNTLTIRRGWYTRKNDAFSALHNAVSGSMANDGVFYLVWDYDADCWMITSQFINIFEE